MEKPKKLYVRPMDMNIGELESVGGRGSAGQRGIKGRKMGQI